MKIEDLENAHELITEKFKAGDIEGVKELLDPDKVGGVEGVNQIGELLKTFLSLKPKEEDFKPKNQE